MKRKLLSLFLVLTIGMGMAANLTAVYAEELTDYVIDLTAGGAEIQIGTEVGTVKVNQGGIDKFDNLDPAASRFIFTTNGKLGSSFGIQYGVSADLNLVFRNCRVRQNAGAAYSAYNDLGTGLVKLMLGGKNELWSGNSRSGLRIPSGRTYEVRGLGQLSVKGGSPIGVCGNSGYEEAGTLILYEGTISSDDNNKSNATVNYMGGSLKVSLKDNAPVKNSTGDCGFQYKYAGGTESGTTPEIFDVILSKGELSSEISDLQQISYYECRAWGINVEGEKIYSEWVSFRTKMSYNVTITGGTVTAGTQESDGKYVEGNITVTADNDYAIFLGWYDETGIQVSDELVYTFVLTGDISLEARYHKYDDFLTIEDETGIDEAIFENGGDLPWIIEGLESEEPPYLRSGAITNRMSSSLIMKLNLSEAYRITFQWKVSSEKGCDKLKFILNGEEQYFISGLQDWEEAGVSMPAGTHTIEWRYTKDSTISEGSDCGYLKGLRLAPVPMVTVSAQPDESAHGSVSPESVQFPQGANASFIAVPASGYYLAYWQDESGNRISYEEVLTVPVTTPKTYMAVFDVLNQDYSALLAPESEKLTFDTWGRIWTMQSDGSARSGALDNGDRSVLRTTVTVPEGEQRVLMFDWRTSTRNDYLMLYVNGERWSSISGVDSGWKKDGIILPSGTYTMEWVYQMGTSFMLAEAEETGLLATEVPEDCGWVKNILFKTPELYSVNIACNPEHGVAEINWASNSDVGGKFYEGTWVNITAKLNDGYYLKEWKDGEGNTVSTHPNFDFILSGDTTYTAIFEQLSLYDAIVEETSRPYFTFKTGGGEAWTVADGIAESGKGYSELDAVVTVPQGEGAKLFTFEWKVSSNSYGGDNLNFMLDENYKESIVGVYGGWARYAVVLEEGEHALKWRYVRESPYPDGEDRGWLRNLELREPGNGFVSLNITSDMNGKAAASPIGRLTEGTPVQLSAVADSGYACVGWMDQSGNMVSEWPNFTAYVYGDQTYTPVFEKESVFYESSSARAVITSGFSGDKTVIFAAYNDLLCSH